MINCNENENDNSRSLFRRGRKHKCTKYDMSR